jgi:hypothetical protein
MKLSHFLILAFFGATIALISCNSKKEDSTTQEQTTVSPEGTMTQDPTLSASPTASTGTEPHYKCTTAGCTGSGTAQGKCPVCGSDLVHNQAFHNQAPGAAGSNPANPVQVTPNSGSPTLLDPATGKPTTPTPPPAKNAKGEFHYKCPNGHDGGATAGNCATCGTALVHNQAYHN